MQKIIDPVTGKISIRFRNSRGVRRQKTFPARTPTNVLIAYEEREKNQSKLGSMNDWTLEEFCDYWLLNCAPLRQRAPTIKSSKQIIENHILRFFKAMALSEIRPSHMLEFQKHLHKRFKPQTINNVFSTLSGIMRDAVLTEAITVNPATGIRSIRSRKADKQLPKFYTFEQLDRFLTTAKELDYAVFIVTALAATSGMRPGELRGLKKDVIDFSTGEVEIRRNWDYRSNCLNEFCKWDTDRNVTIPDEVVDLLRMYSVNLRHGQFLFPYIYNSWALRFIQPICEKAGVPYLGLHVFRHTFATHLAMHGEKVEVISKLLGHRKLEMTMKYIHLAEAFMKTQGATKALTKGMGWSKKDRGLRVVSGHESPSVH